jgi:hypothetical protein
MIRVKNTKSEADTWCGMNIEPSVYYEIEALELFRWQNDSKVLLDVATGNLLVNNGTADLLDISAAINYLKNIDSSPKDSDGATILRQKAAKAGWKAQFHAIRIKTATTNGVHNKDKNGNDLGFCTYTMFNSENQVTTDPTQCTKTVVTWEPTHDMEIVGGRLLQKQAATDDVWIYVTAAAHIPTNMGGSIAFLEGGVNLQDVADGGEVDFDGRAAKYIAYDATYHSGKFEILFKHPVNFQHTSTLVFELFKP